MYINHWESNIGNNNQITQFGDSQHQTLDCTSLTSLETIPTVPVRSNEFPTTTADESPFLLCQPSQQHNYSTNTIKHDQFMTSSLQLVAESLMSRSDDSISSSEKYGQLHSSSGKYDNKPFCDHFPQEHKKVMENDDASPSQKSLQISFQRNQPDKQSSPYGVPFATSSNSDSRRTAPGKRRIRWTKDLHELFIVIVNHLGGPEKAKPKAILEMMGSDMLTIPNVKSHLQKYRSALHMHAALKGRSNERHRKDDISELQLKIQMQIEESGQLQLEIQKSNHQQMEMQRNLQLLIEQQKKQLKLLLDQQKQRTNLEKNGGDSEPK